MFLFLTLFIPFTLFLGGAYVFHYPPALGLLYGFNMVLMYLVLWKVSDQVVKVQTQKMSISGDSLVLMHQKVFTSFPVVRHMDLEVPLDSIRGITLTPTHVGYFLTVRFEQEGKTMGVDMDINPLSTANRDTIQAVLKAVPGVETDKGTEDLLNSYEDKALSWKWTYMCSGFVLILALAIFLFISIFLGTRLH